MRFYKQRIDPDLQRFSDLNVKIKFKNVQKYIVEFNLNSEKTYVKRNNRNILSKSQQLQLKSAGVWHSQ